MKNSKTWWSEIKADQNKLNGWLKDQYHGELTAVDRIQKHLLSKVTPGSDTHKKISFIRDQEADHANWIKDLLVSRGLEATKLDKVERYWDETLTGAIGQDLEYGCAVAAHAEEMRLERIQVIAADPECPEDIRSVFQKILPQELGHASIFSSLAGNRKGDAAEGHAKGLEALGLIL